jgi:hypothetical protein
MQACTFGRVITDGKNTKKNQSTGFLHLLKFLFRSHAQPKKAFSRRFVSRHPIVPDLLKFYAAYCRMKIKA